MITWILVANRATAKLFERTGKTGAVKLIDEFEHPAGRLHEGDLVTGGKGAVFQSAGRGQQHATGPEVSATEHETEVFAKELSNMLGSGRTKGRFDWLELVAAPSFLGHLRSAMDHVTASKVVKATNKNVADKSVREIEAQCL